MKYDLIRLVKGSGIRRSSITFPAQRLALHWEVRLAQIALAPVKHWESKRGEIEQRYAALLASYTADNASEEMSAALVSIEQQAANVIVTLLPKLQEWLSDLSVSHARRWSQIVRSKTKIDPWPYIDLRANATRIDLYQERIASLITNINQQARKDVAEVVWKGVIDRTPPRVVGKEIAKRLNVARSRANFIASDQANKVHSLLTQIRQEEAGIDEFVWETAKDSRVRATHAALQGRVFKYSKPPSIGLPATEPRCRCSARAHLDLS